MTKPTFERLKRWSSKLDACIRCGYCYEHCPVFKHTRWESDAPRSKLILLYGLLAGELEPSERVTQRLFDCFHCKRCEVVCSSAVPFTEILDDARADLAEAGLDLDGTTSYNRDDACARCLACLRVCKHEARTLVDQEVVIDRVRCAGCGACVDACPRTTIRIRRGYGTGADDLREQLTDFLTDAANPEAKAVVFSCNWANYAGLQHSRYLLEPVDPEYKLLVNVCAGRIPAHLVMEALHRNAWGVLITGCPDDSCEHEGIARARGMVSALRQITEELGLGARRIQLAEVVPGNQGQFQQAVSAFMSEIKELGPIGRQ